MITAYLIIWFSAGAPQSQAITARSEELAMGICEGILFGGHWDGQAAICTTAPP